MLKTELKNYRKLSILIGLNYNQSELSRNKKGLHFQHLREMKTSKINNKIREKFGLSFGLLFISDKGSKNST